MFEKKKSSSVSMSSGVWMELLLLGGSSMSSYKATAAYFVFCFPLVPMFWPGALCSHFIKPSSGLPLSLSPSSPSQTEPP